MPPKGKQDLKKLENERLTALVMELLKEEENKYCADCEAKQPRWASWNLGVFLCIRCAGLHRNLGVHISKVKSVSLDTWLPEQVQSMRVMGNAKAKAVYEAELPNLFRRPQTDQSLEQFIRAKYDSKRYILKGWIPPTVNVSDLPSLVEPAKPVSTKKIMSVGNSEILKSQVKSEPPKKQEDSLVDLFDTSPTNNVANTNQPDFFGLDAASPTQNAPKKDDNLDDLFGSMVTAPSFPTSNSNSFAESKNVDQISTGLESLDFNAPPRAVTNDDIMALYNKPSPFGVPLQQNTQFFNAGFPVSSQSPPQNWPNDGFTATSPNQTNFKHTSSFSSPPIQQKPASNAFDDLFATATAHFSNLTPAKTPQNNFSNKVQSQTTATSPAHQDLESLFM